MGFIKQRIPEGIEAESSSFKMEPFTDLIRLTGTLWKGAIHSSWKYPQKKWLIHPSSRYLHNGSILLLLHYQHRSRLPAPWEGHINHPAFGWSSSGWRLLFPKGLLLWKKMTPQALDERMSKKNTCNGWETVRSPWDKAPELPKAEEPSKLIAPRWDSFHLSWQLYVKALMDSSSSASTVENSMPSSCCTTGGSKLTILPGYFLAVPTAHH